jgi:hypothetical protein
LEETPFPGRSVRDRQCCVLIGADLSLLYMQGLHAI